MKILLPLLIILLLATFGCKPRMIDETQADSPNLGLLDICLRDAASENPTISEDPMCKEALRNL